MYGVEEAQEVPLEHVASPEPSSTRQGLELTLPAYDFPVAQASPSLGITLHLKQTKNPSYQQSCLLKNLPSVHFSHKC